ncbi:MAG: helix-turn-helix transcriptional regulator [Bradyrhizobium sp.]|jgi:DNA-binding XRE family transcriptional regulator|uniref:helix-turn-helix domain-containing protein n=1 Tax=Bradyrhizobium TaxID=374 RepID=UPI001557E2DB|nr:MULTISPECIES: helix-turn-helix transcriptional regulator [unclassified Bradyrhizobium]MDU1493707.1 helix-turn-helix transcriptional regulator [Bradyrhizobium sp.]MDU1544000.1 helix-turn-helix transcriptional regulator [Bradyrhizobium sp.]MDU1665529.1 helix-turn-helix transcriptional regulator [Bradyrhizobium sp.]MDU1691855.1 helix-turn-helix transcriptional regulator [Bradyrhizobium sp.]MDU1806780.1 helix-turn-helix transcriptional regulator [Bradyrhizobium sp.]
MTGLELKEWRRAMDFTQQQAGAELGVTRATIQNWEYEITPIPVTVGLACRQLLRRKKRRPDFGPVTLVYSIIPLSNASNLAGEPAALTCKRCVNNIDAFRRINELSEDSAFFNPMILDDLGSAIWSGYELTKQCEGFGSASVQTRPGL